MKKTSLFLALVLALTSLSGCGKKEEKEIAFEVEEVYPWNEDGVSDSSDIPDWTGPTTELTYWYGHGPSADSYNPVSEDVVTPELERITGIKFDNENRMDNGGQNVNVKLAMTLASDDFPNILFNDDNLPKFVEADVLYDLKPYIEKYCPNIKKKYPAEVLDEIEKKGGAEGKIYELPSAIGGDYLDSLEDFDTARIGKEPMSYTGYVYVRDDILKKLYPNAKTADEIEALYREKGEFTEEDIFDVKINSYDEFVEFLRAIRKLDIKEDNKTVYSTYAFTGSDNWSVMNCLWSAFDGRGPNFNYMFTYWDAGEKKVDNALRQDFFKNNLLTWNMLLREDVISPDSLIDPQDTFKTKLNNGLYAVTSSIDVPDENVLKAAGKNFRYRKLYLDIPMNTNKFKALRQSNFGTVGISVFKTTSEQDLIQFLRYFDFCISDLGEKLMSWGPRSAGLWEEADGKRRFIDKEVEDYVVYGKDNDAKNYNLINCDGTVPTGSATFTACFAYNNISKFHPCYVYDRERSSQDIMNAFSPGSVRDYDFTYYEMSPDIWNYTKIDKVQTAWGNRENVESALTRILASADDKNFNENYEQMLLVLDQSGWNDEFLDVINTEFEKENADEMNEIRK